MIAMVEWTGRMSRKTHCPFCGFNKIFCYTETSVDGMEITATIKCEICGANVYYADKSKETAIKYALIKWETRV